MKKRYLVGGVILVLAVGWLLYTSFGSSVTYYVTISELLDKGYETCDTNIRVAGKVADDSIKWNAKEIELEFAVVQGDDTLRVIYKGIKPDGFKVGSDIMVEGTYHSDKIFRASSILMRCPSKYIPEE